MRRRWQSKFDATGPDDSVLDCPSYTREDELLDFRDVLQFGARAEEGGRGELQGKVGVKGHVNDGLRCRGRREGVGELEGEGSRESLEGQSQGDGQDGESGSREVDE